MESDAIQKETNTKSHKETVRQSVSQSGSQLDKKTKSSRWTVTHKDWQTTRQSDKNPENRTKEQSDRVKKEWSI